MLIGALIFLSQTGSAHIDVDPSRVLNRIQPAMYGACIEDVNHEIYGGLYAQRIFGESFLEPAQTVVPAGWHSYGGEWSSGAGEVSGTAGGGPKLVFDRIEADTVAAGVRIDDDRDGNAGLLVCVNRAGVGADNFDGYEISLDAHAHRIVLGRHEHDFRLLQSVPAPVSLGEWHRLSVNLAGSRIRVYLDGEPNPLIDFVDSHRLRSGGIALRTWQVPARFRDIKLDGSDIAPALKKNGVSGMWDPVGDCSASITNHRQVIRNGGDGLCGIANRGLNRWGISVKAGQTMEGRLHVQGNVPYVLVALQSIDGARTYARQRVPITTAWRKASFRLTSTATDPKARFCILLDRHGEITVDHAVLLDGDRFHGLPIRGDIARGLKEEGLTFLRYGGTMVNVPGYRWKKMIGDPDRRPAYRGNWYPYSTNGFGIFDFLNFCEAERFGAAFAINIEETPQDAADLADYLTAPASNSWGKKRAEDGHPAPYRPDYIEIGNEEGIGGDPAVEMAHYAERFRLLAKAIHGRSPNLKLVCAAWWMPESSSMKTVFDAIDGSAAAWDLHVSSDDPNSGAQVSRELEQAQSLFKNWNPSTKLKVVVFEENGNRHDQQRALGHATTINATRRFGDFVLADCAANCLQPLGQNDNGWDQGQLFFTPDRTIAMPPYWAQQILSTDALPIRVGATAGRGLDVLAAKSEDGRSLALTVVNTANRPMTAIVAAKGFLVKSAKATTLADRNSPEGALRCELDGGHASLVLPAYSVTSIRLKRR